MNCEKILKAEAKFIDMADTVRHAAQLMRDHDIGFLPICDGKRVVGTVTDRDLTVRVLADGKGVDTPLAEFGLNEPITCKKSTTLDDAHGLMSKYQVSRLVCVNDTGELTGVISLSDLLLESSAESSGRTAKSIKKQSKSKGGKSKDKGKEVHA